ncbi:MAG: anhydro-N-acetylmuramic acid kinase [Burkholderiales bacterium]
MSELYVGLMSGTSLDGVDAVLADFGHGKPRLLAHNHSAFPPALQAELTALNHPGNDELARAARAANDLARIYAACVQALLAQCTVAASAIAAIGCHGQTVRHQPAVGYTLQLVNGSLLAELTDIDVVCDFRGRDVAAGGQGAPLVPAFHHAAFASAARHRVIVNIGGIANITDLPPAANVTGFDCGPGNLLLDAWTQRHLRQPFDRDGAWAHSGAASADLLAHLLADEYFRRAPPKSSGRETFNLAWLEKQLKGTEKPADVAATLLALTAGTIYQAIEKFCVGAGEVYLCGGGARNVALVKLLAAQLAPRQIAATDVIGVNAEHVEALAFAWLARQTMHAQTGNLPAVTGARGARILGAIYRA